MNRFATVLIASLLPATAFAADVEVMSAGAIGPGLMAFAQAVKRETGHVLTVYFNTAPQIASRLAAGESYDILIAPPDVIDKAAKDGKVVADSRVPVGRVGVGVVVRSDAVAPDIASVDAFKQSLLGADSVVYNSASSGIYLDKLFDKLGILPQLKSKTTRFPDGAAVMDHVSKSTGNEIGLGAITEIKAAESKGVKLVGPLPADAQNYTSYDAVLMNGAAAPDAAKAVLERIASPAGKAAFASGGVE
jgi:molybdate transport system substrate-binding protein